MPYRNKTTGEIISDNEFQTRFGQQINLQQPLTPTATAEPRRLSFLQRAKLSFGGPEQIEELKRREEEAGLRGRLDIGDIADVAGSAIPAIGATIGGIAGVASGIPTLGITSPVGGAIGSGIGATAGEAVKRTIGQALGVRPDVSVGSEAAEPLITGLVTAAGTKGLELGGRFLASRLPKLLGLFTGETEVVSTALRNPKVADLGIQQGDMALRNAVDTAAQNSIKIRNDLITAHKLAFDKLVGRFPTRLSSKKEVLGELQGILENEGVKIGRGGVLDFSVSPIRANPGEITKIEAAYDALKKWSNFRLDGINEYKQLVGKLTRFADEAGIPSKSPTLGRFYNSLNDLIKDKLPPKTSAQYAEANKRFADVIDLYDGVVDAFNKGDPFARISQVFSKNKDSLRMLLDFYEKKTGTDIPAIQAGRELAAERSAAFGFLNPREWVDLIIPPRFQARVVTGTGKAQQFTRKIIPEEVRAGIRGVVSEQAQGTFRQ